LQKKGTGREVRRRRRREIHEGHEIQKCDKIGLKERKIGTKVIP
jgi:hypothetical protein